MERKNKDKWRFHEVPIAILGIVSLAVIIVFFISLRSEKGISEDASIINSVITLALTIPAIVLPIPLTAKDSPEAKYDLQNILYWVLGFCFLAIIKFLFDILTASGILQKFSTFFSVLLSAGIIISYLFILLFSLQYIRIFLKTRYSPTLQSQYSFKEGIDRNPAYKSESTQSPADTPKPDPDSPTQKL